MNSGDVPYFDSDSAHIIAQNFLNPQVGNLENTEIDCVGAVTSLHDQMGNGIIPIMIIEREREVFLGKTVKMCAVVLENNKVRRLVSEDVYGRRY